MARPPVVYRVSHPSIGVHNGPGIRTEILEHVCNCSAPVIVDLSGVQEIDTYGYGVLIFTARMLPRTTRMVLVATSPDLMALFDRVRAHDVLSVANTVDEAQEMIRCWIEKRESRETIAVSHASAARPPRGEEKR